MKNRALFWIQAFLLLCIGVCHAYALSHDTYWYFPILNRVMHFSGGVWVALASLWILAYVGGDTGFARLIVIVMLVSLGWEVFEVAIGMTHEANYVVDTVLDLIMDFLGGVVGFILARPLLTSRGTMSAQ